MISVLRACALGLTLFLSTISAATAADQTMTLKLGAGSTVTIERPFKAVLIGDPDVLSIHKHDDRSVAIEPLSLGATNVVFVDERGYAIVNISIVVCAASASVIDQDDVAD
jgi:Flp pilus assembly secretin CpaC